MELQPKQMLAVLNALKAAYPTTVDLDPVVFFSTEIPFADLHSTGGNRSTIFFEVIRNINSFGLSEIFIRAIIADKPNNETVQTHLPPILGSLIPVPGIPAHQHLSVKGFPFANRRTVRGALDDMLKVEALTTLVLRGPPLSGASYTKWLISHVATANDIVPIHIDFELPSDITPTGVADAIKIEMNITDQAPNIDTPGDAHLAGRLVRWLSSKVKNGDKTYWIIFDNANRASVPRATKEMIIHFIRFISNSGIDRIKLFVLGFDGEITNAGVLQQVRELPLTVIGRPEIREFLVQFETEYQVIPGFSNVDDAADALSQDIDTHMPSRTALGAVTSQLDSLLRQVQV